MKFSIKEKKVKATIIKLVEGNTVQEDIVIELKPKVKDIDKFIKSIYGNNIIIVNSEKIENDVNYNIPNEVLENYKVN